MTKTKALEQQPLINNENETPLPWNKVLIIGIILFGNTFSMNVIFPFLPFMTHDFFPELHPREIGYKAGYLGSAFSLGSFLSAYFCGKLSDHLGRKPVLLGGLLGTFFCILSFGFSKSFYTALVSRFFWGLFYGNVVVAKTCLSEVLDSSNQARGFAIIGIQSAVGRLIGPTLGGLLSKPAEKYSFLNVPFCREFPYALPCIVAAVAAMCGFIGTLMYLEETVNRMDCDKDETEEFEIFSCDSPTGSPILLTPKSLKSKQKQKIHMNYVEKKPGERNASLFSLLSTPKIIITSLLYGLIAAVWIMTNEIMPLWLLNSPSDGGYRFTTNEIGFLFVISAPFEILFQVYMLPNLVQKYQTLGSLQGSFIGLSILSFLLPFTSWTSYYKMNWIIQWFVLCTIFVLMIMCAYTTYTCVTVLINYSTTYIYRGRVNGIAQTMASATRIIFPSVASILFAWSESNGFDFPLNYHFLFVLSSILCVSSYYLSKFLPDSINCNPDYE